MTTQTAAAETPLFTFDNSYARLPDRFFARVNPTPVRAPRMLRLNEDLARSLGLDVARLSSAEGLAVLAGNAVPNGAAGLAMAYAGHQFGFFSPQLGDGRAWLMGEIQGRDGRRYDLHLKGSGRTPFSRGGDGRAAVGPVLREYLLGEAMTGLGIPSTRVLAAVATGERIMRETPLPGAVLTRVAQSHLRFGTFEYFAARNDVDALRALADHALKRHQPNAVNTPNPYLALLQGVVDRTAALVAQWLSVGFIHGVMNTDNMTISGETLDYGPCAFMDTCHPDTVFSSIDRDGRYAYANQPAIAHWNLVRLARALLPLLSDDTEKAREQAQAAVDSFEERFETVYNAIMNRKLGLHTSLPGDTELVGTLLSAMANQEADFTLTFRALSGCSGKDPSLDGPVRSLFKQPAAFDAWATRWRARIAQETTSEETRKQSMRAVNPAFIARNHNVEAALNAATRDGNLQPFEDLLAVLASPFEEHPQHAALARPPEPHEVVQATFCGT